MLPKSLRSALGIGLSAIATFSQPAAQNLQFDAASIKLVPQERAGKSSFHSHPGRLDFKNTALAVLVRWAYAVPWYQVVSMKAVDSAGRRYDGHEPLYDIAATMPAGTSSDQQRPMLQSLLAERLNFKAHRETRDVPIYAIVIAKGGLRIHKSQNPDPDAPIHNADMSLHEWRYQNKMPLSTLIGFLRWEVDRPLVDYTGLDGFYDVDLRWPHEEQGGNGGDVGVPGGGNMASLFSAMGKQLGLKVESRKLPLEMVVIDRFDRVPVDK